MTRGPFHAHRGTVAPLLRNHIDTDQIIPKQFLTRIQRSGFGEFLFNDWRVHPDGTPESSFVLNQPRYAGTSVLVAGVNFGCGSSREHAVWALTDFGFRVVIAASFADIFFNNAIANGLLPATVSEADAAWLAERALDQPPFEVDADLDTCEIRAGDRTVAFTIDPVARRRLIEGLDDIGRILRHESAIAAYERLAKLRSSDLYGGARL
jgi:3-isopropylmalate/(R)-2-methylmalate dehydratase small subunit